MKAHLRWIAVCTMVALGGLAASAPTPTTPSPAQKDLGQVEEMTARLLARLQEETIWKEESRKTELLESLALARTLRAEALVPPLLEHITYMPVYKPLDIAELTQHMPKSGDLYPAWASLIAIGPPAVQPILEEMKRTDPSAPVDLRHPTMRGQEMLEHKRRPGFLARCLRDVYYTGGHGAELAKLRLQLEIEKSSGQAKVFLTKYLDHQAFRSPGELLKENQEKNE